MRIGKWIKIIVGIRAVLFVYSAVSSDFAKHVIAGEISGVVVEKETGRPIPGAVVAIRFERVSGNPAALYSPT